MLIYLLAFNGKQYFRNTRSSSESQIFLFRVVKRRNLYKRTTTLNSNESAFPFHKLIYTTQTVNNKFVPTKLSQRDNAKLILANKSRAYCASRKLWTYLIDEALRCQNLSNTWFPPPPAPSLYCWCTKAYCLCRCSLFFVRLFWYSKRYCALRRPFDRSFSLNWHRLRWDA